MGGADIIPGVSGGTVALILGIYERLVTAISRFDLRFIRHLGRREWGAGAAHVDLRFLAALGLGIGTGVVGLASLMNHLLSEHPEPTLAVFFGLILASSFVLARSLERWKAASVLLGLAGGGFAFWLVVQPFMAGTDSYAYLFLCGTVAICAMILPGISGTFILLILGEYDYVTGVIRGLKSGEVTPENVLSLAVFGVGCAVGLLAFSKFLRWLLARYHRQTMALLCGFMIGSLRRIWPFKAESPGAAEAADLKHQQLTNVWPEAFDAQVTLALGLAVAAVLFVLALDFMARRHQRAVLSRE
jgi:putative membrane protein